MGQGRVSDVPREHADQTRRALADHYVVAVVRTPDAAAARRDVTTLVEAGIDAIEVTFTVPDAGEVLRWARASHPDVILGAGTLRTVAQVEAAVSAGCDFLVSPGVEPTVAEHMTRSGLLCAFGALTPTEVMAVTALEGSPLVKLFPASLGGQGYLRGLRAVFPAETFMPTGGVSVENMASWAEAGAAIVGLGDALARPDGAGGVDPSLASQARRVADSIRPRDRDDQRSVPHEAEGETGIA